MYFPQASSLAFVPSHLGATFTLGRSTALVLDVAYKEAQIMPVAEGVPLAVQFDSLPYAGEAIHKYEYKAKLLFYNVRFQSLDKSNCY